VANGGSGGGIVIALAYMTGTAYGSSVALTAIATVVAPSTTTVTITIA
jgi:ribosome recycling factor